jgi:aldehyde dehydrogenase (NAD+)
MANNSCYGLAASVWSENIGLALETAVSLRVGALWINAHNMFDAAAGFGGYKESGYGREGGEEGLYAYLKPKWQQRGQQNGLEAAKDSASSWGKVDRSENLPSKASGSPLPGAQPTIDRTPKMYVGGKQKRPDNGTSMNVHAHDGSIYSQVRRFLMRLRVCALNLSLPAYYTPFVSRALTGWRWLAKRCSRCSRGCPQGARWLG